MKQYGIKRLVFIIFITLLGITLFISFIRMALSPPPGNTSYSEKQRQNNDWDTESANDRISANEFKDNYESSKSRKDYIIQEEQGQNRENQDEEDDDEFKVYFGFLHLRVNNRKESISAISSLADEAGGYVEASYENTIIIRIPKELFTETLTALMDMGEVLNKSIETYDVTEFFQDLSSRLEISTRTRDRLYALLERTKDVKERLKILKEIRRLSEEIETISLTLENIKRLISFSRITIELEQRLSDLSYEDKGTIPFSWIASLDPFHITLKRLAAKVTIKTGDEFAVFDNNRYFFAESTDGVRLHIASTPNNPRGDAQFWQKALEYHLSRFYRETELIELGSFRGVQFKSKDAVPFYYITCVAIKDNDIVVCEVLFPNQETFSELGDTVKTYIKECIIE